MGIEIYNALCASKTPLEFIISLATQILKKSYDELRGKPIKYYNKPDNITTLSMAIYNDKDIDGVTTKAYPEVDRTGVTHYYLFMLLTNNPSGYPNLSTKMFQELQELAFNAVKKEGKQYDREIGIQLEDIDPIRLEAVTVALAFHDLPKIEDFVIKVKQLAESINLVFPEGGDHDVVNNFVFSSGNEELIAELYPDFFKLGQEQRDMALSFIRSHIYDENTGKKITVESINRGRAYQLEDAASMFYELQKVAEQRKKIKIHAVDKSIQKLLMILDLTSVRGHEFDVPELNGNQVITKGYFWKGGDPMIATFINIPEIEEQVLSGEIDALTAYNKIVDFRAKEFGLDGWETDKSVYAATKIAANISSRFGKNHSTSHKEAQRILDFFRNNKGAENAWITELQNELCETGFDGKPALYIGYSPDMAKIISDAVDTDPANASLTADERFDLKIEIYLKSLHNIFMPLRKAIASDSDAKKIGVELEGLLQSLKANYKMFYHNPVSIAFNPTTEIYSVTPVLINDQKESEADKMEVEAAQPEIVPGVAYQPQRFFQSSQSAFGASVKSNDANPDLTSSKQFR